MLRALLAALSSLPLVSCLGKINVMGRDIPDSEYKEGIDRSIARERQGLEPEGGHDEHGRIPSWEHYWYFHGASGDVTKPQRNRRLRRYIITKRRSAGLREYSWADTEPNSDPATSERLWERMYHRGDPRIFQ